MTSEGSRHAHATQIHMHAKTHTHKINLFKNLKILNISLQPEANLYAQGQRANIFDFLVQDVK